MTELTLEESIATFKQQLLAIENTLSVTPDNLELLSIRNDIIQFLELANVYPITTTTTTTTTTTADNTTNNNYSENSSESNLPTGDDEAAYISVLIKDQEQSNNEDFTPLFIGDRCSAPYSTEWSITEMHNAILLDINKHEGVCSVLFTQPTHLAMVPCDYFLNDSCKFDDICRYSHGYIVKSDDIQCYIDSAVSILNVGKHCLALDHNDLIWKRAVISKVVDESECEIYFENIKEHRIMGLQDIFIANTDVDDFQEEFHYDEFGDDLDVIKIISSINDENLSLKLEESEIGSWEQHTRGIGSKLMRGMGYSIGEGLGPQRNGRKEPVEIVILPQGKSLDECRRLRAAGRISNAITNKKYTKINNKTKKKHYTNNNTHKNEKKSTEMFDFLNKIIGNRNNKTKLDTKVLSKKFDEINTSCAKRLKLSREIKELEKQIQNLSDSLQRNIKSKDFTTNIKIQLGQAEELLEQLKEEEKMINYKLQNISDRVKISEF